MSATEVLGVDGTRRGWVVVRLIEGGFAGARSFKQFGALLEAHPHASVVAVDIPIGLPDTGRRSADLMAREVLKFRQRSVFFVPPRAVLAAPTYEQAKHIVPGLSTQTYALRKKIFEVERFASDRRIVEVHPEVSFWALNGSKPLDFGKKSWNGLMLRLALLQKAGVELPPRLEDINDAGADDLLDAAAAAWSGMRVARGEARSLPDPPETGKGDRPVAIWY